MNQCKEWAVSLSLGEGVGLLAEMPNEFQCQLGLVKNIEQYQSYNLLAD